MAIRYVKDFEFPAAAGYTKSAPSKVTGQMLAKGGPAKAPKGIMVMIGVGKPVKKAEGGAITDAEREALAQMAGDANATTEAERIMRGSDTQKRMPVKKVTARKGSPYIPGSNIPQSAVRTPEEQAAAEAGAYKKGGKAKMAAKVGKVMHEFKAGELHSGSKKGPEVKNRKQAIAIALSEAGKAKKAGGGMAQKVQMAKTNAIEASLKGQKKTPYAKGGYAEGGEPKPVGYHVIDTQTGDIVGKFKNASAASSMVDRKDNQHGGYRYQRKAIWPGEEMVPKAKGGMAKHEDVAMDRKLVKQMVKPAALKKAEGGVAARPLSLAVRPGARQSAPDIAKMGATMGKAMGGPAMPPMKRGPAMPTLQRPTPARPGAVPVAPAGPMIPAPAQGGVGVNAKRPGGPNVGAIRAAMARAATAARPEASPAMMKKGGKTKC